MEKLTYPLPRLKADTRTLFSLYHNNCQVDTADIRTAFNVSAQTAIKVCKKVKEYIQTEEPEYIPPKEHIVPVRWLFKLYGWDIKEIDRSMKVLVKNADIQ